MPVSSFFEKHEGKVYIGELPHFHFPLHVHEVVEAITIRKGTCAVQIGQRRYTLRAGDCALIFPFIPHSFEEMSEDMSGLTVIFPPDTIAEYAHSFRRTLPEEAIVRKEQTGVQLRRLMELYDEIPEAEISIYQQAFLHLFLALILNRMTLTSTGGGTGQTQITRVLQYIADHALEPISLRSIAAGLEINEFYLSHMISEQLQTSLRSLINSIRVSYAIALMRNPEKTLTAISEECGYTNIQTFRKAFKDNTGMLPTEYLQKEYPRRRF